MKKINLVTLFLLALFISSTSYSQIKIKYKIGNDEKDIFIWREKQASIKNLPPSFIFEDKFLKQITKEVKKNKSQEIIKFFKDSSSINDFLQHIKL